MADECCKLIEKLQLVPYPVEACKGLHFRELYRSNSTVKPLEDDRKKRNAFTSIYCLGKSGVYGIWRRLKSDETFYYHRGDALRIAVIQDDGTEVVTVGDIFTDEKAVYQYTVPANHWFNYKVSPGPHGYCLLGVAVAPGFDISDSVVKEPKELINEFPQHRKIIEEFTAPK